MTDETTFSIEGKQNEGFLARVHRFTNETEFWQAVNRMAQQVLTEVEHPHIAAIGGSSAQFFDHIPSRHLHESDVWLVDERYVPADDEDSNAKLINTKVRASVRAFHPFNTELELDACADDYEQLLRARLAQAEYLFDLTILGVGPDGHTASLFPQSPALDVDDFLVTVSHTDTFAVSERLSLTWPAIELSQRIIVLLIGSSKKGILDMITQPEIDPFLFPARRLLDWPQVDVCFLDV